MKFGEAIEWMLRNPSKYLIDHKDKHWVYIQELSRFYMGDRWISSHVDMKVISSENFGIYMDHSFTVAPGKKTYSVKQRRSFQVEAYSSDDAKKLVKAGMGTLKDEYCECNENED